MKKKKIYIINVLPWLFMALTFFFFMGGCANDDNGSSGPEQIDLTGTWTQTDPCDILTIFDLTQEGKDLTGTQRASTGTVDGPLSGSVDGISVYLECTLPHNMWCKYDLTVSGDENDKMSGSYTLSGGSTGSIHFEKED